MLRANKVTKKEVTCPKVIKKKVTSRDFEKLEVAQLKCQIEPCSKPSDLFEKLQEKRRIRHENIIKQLAISLNKVNMKIEKNIRISSLELKAHLKDYDNKLKVILQSIDKLEIAMYCGSVFIELQNKVNEYKSQQQQLVDDFYEDLTTFENNRAKKNAKLLHLATEEISKIGYFLPYDIQTFVETETLKMNQLSLNNRRCYEDLKLTLTLVTEQTFKSFMDKVFCIRDNWVQRKVHESSYNTVPESEDRTRKSIQKFLTRLELRGEELEIHDNPYSPYSTCRAEDWVLNVEKIISIVDSLRKNLIEVFKKTIKAIYNGFGPEIEEIKVGMSMIEDLVIEERSVKPLLIDVQNNPVKDSDEMETHWQSTLEDIRNHLKYLADFIREVGKLWDGHVERVCESKKLILRALEKAEQNSEAVQQDSEVKINLGLDALRQEPSHSKLEKLYQTVLTTLNELKANYESTYLEEVSIIEDFYKMIDLEADVLSADIKEFIIETCGMKFIHGFSGQFRYLRDVDFVGDMIFREMKLCSQQIQNLKFWKQGIWVAFETISGRTKESLKPRAEKWVKSRVEALAEKKTVQLELLDKRIQRIWTEVYNKRMTEIKAHQNMFEKHKEKIRNSLRKAKDELKNLISNRLEKIKNAKETLTEIEESAVKENLPGVIRGNQVMIERKKKECEKDIQMEFQRFRAYCETKLSDNHELNVQFMKSIRLFHENGDYNSEEAKSYMHLLEGIDKDISTEIKNIIKESEREEEECIKEVSEHFNHTISLFMDLYEETIFNQEIQQRFQNFVALIQESAKILKLDFDFLNEHYSCTRKYAENPVGTLDLSEDRLWNFLIHLLHKNVSNLLYPMKLPQSLVQIGNEEKQESTEECVSVTGSCCCAGKYPIHLSNSKVTLRKVRRVESLPCTEYGDKLFNCEIPLDDNENFMSTMSKDISAEFSYIERVACNFYKNIQGRKIIRGDLIPESYENFIERILTKFSYYNIQIQKYWLKILSDFLPLVGDIKELCNALLLRKLNSYKNLALTALKNFEADFRECIQSQMCENSKVFDELDKKLLPLHGYPHNVHLLNELEELVVAKTANQEIKWEIAFKNFKGQLKCFRGQHIQDKFEISNIELLYIKLRDTLFTEDLGRNLMQEICNICNNGGFCKKKMFKNSFRFDNKPETDTENFQSELIPEEHELHITDENSYTTQDLIQYLKEIIERDEFSMMQGPKRPSTAESFEENPGESVVLCKDKVNVFMNIIDFGEHATRALQVIEKYIRYLKSFAESQENFHEEELFKWLSRWKCNVKKVQKLYRITCETNSSVSGVVATALLCKDTTKPTSQRGSEGKRISGQNLKSQILSEKNNKPNPEKTSASVTSPRLCPTSKLDIKDTTCNIPILKIRCPRDRPISDEYKKRSDVLEHSKTNLQKSKLTESNNSGQVGFTNAALFLTSPRNYHGLIPVLHKRSLNLLRMSPPSTRSASPLKKLLPKDKSSSKVKTITLEPKKKKVSDASRSPSPVKRAAISYKQSKSRTSTSPIQGLHKNSEKIKQQQTNKQASPRINSPAKRKSKPTVLSSPKLECSSKCKRKELPSNGHSNSVILKQTSQPSLCINEKIIQPQEKISLDHLKNEVYSGDHRRLSFEKVHLCIEKSVENLNTAERKRSYLVTYSSDDYKNQEEISLAFLQDLSSTSITTYSTDGDRKKGSERVNESKAAIRTLSGNELILTPSMKLDIEKGETDDIEISDLLHETGESFEDSKVRIPQDDANEYDSEVSTDGELTERDLTAVSSKCKDLHSGNSLWKSQEADLLNDVDYRQSVYHPAVSRRQKSESMDNEFRPKSRSIEDNYSFTSKMTKRVTRSRSSTLKPKYPTQCFSRDKIEASNNDRSWASNFDKPDGKQMYTPVMQDVPFYGMKRSRTKKERISGALLHFTLKVIRLLAIFNLWPGDNCYMLTSQSLRSSFSSPCMVSEGKLKEDY